MSLALEPGFVYGIVGPSGCGKSSLLGAIAKECEVQPEAVGAGERETAATATSALLIPARAPLLAHHSPIEAVGMLLALDRRPNLQHSRIVEALRVSELPDRFLRRRCGDLAYVGRLSVWLAYQQLTQPAAILIDDLCDELQPDEAEDTAAILGVIARSGATVVFTARDTELAAVCADELLAFVSRSLQRIRRAPHLTDGR